MSSSQERSRFSFRSAGELPVSEAEAARAYWSGLGVQSGYTGDRHWRHFVADRVLGLDPRSVLEFGSNCGRNLVEIGRRRDSIGLVGVDVNPAAVAYGQAEYGLDLRVGDERWLGLQRSSSFDVAFTVSVLDHVAAPWSLLAEMLRVAARGVLLLEPWLGKEGRVVAEGAGGVSREADPYCYSWDYRRFLETRAGSHRISAEPYPLEGVMWGEHYMLFTAVRHGSTETQ